MFFNSFDGELASTLGVGDEGGFEIDIVIGDVEIVVDSIFWFDGNFDDFLGTGLDDDFTSGTERNVFASEADVRDAPALAFALTTEVFGKVVLVDDFEQRLFGFTGLQEVNLGARAFIDPQLDDGPGGRDDGGAVDEIQTVHALSVDFLVELSLSLENIQGRAVKVICGETFAIHDDGDAGVGSGGDLFVAVTDDDGADFVGVKMVLDGESGEVGTGFVDRGEALNEFLDLEVASAFDVDGATLLVVLVPSRGGYLAKMFQDVVHLATSLTLAETTKSVELVEGEAADFAKRRKEGIFIDTRCVAPFSGGHDHVISALDVPLAGNQVTNEENSSVCGIGTALLIGELVYITIDNRTEFSDAFGLSIVEGIDHIEKRVIVVNL